MKLKVVARLVVVGAVLGTAQLNAHHAGSAEFDITKLITIQGTVTIFNMTNPHGSIYLNVKGPDGRVQRYSVETTAAAALTRMGVSKKSLPIGSTIIVEGWPARDGSNKVAGRIIRTVDGKSIYSVDTAGAEAQ